MIEKLKYIILFASIFLMENLYSESSVPAITNFDSTDTPLDLSVPVNFVIDSSENKLKFKINWDSSPESIRYKVFKKTPAEKKMGNPILTITDTTVTEYIDEDIESGKIYEYGVEDYRMRYSSYGYIAAGIKIPPEHYKGKILVLIDETIRVPLDSLLIQFRKDLVGDGWLPVFKDVPRTEEFNPSNVKFIKNKIINEYIKSDSLRSVLLFGRIAVPYSGYFAIDGHSDHIGAWPADTYYADLDGIWTDTASVDTSAADARNHNYPGDGKFDNFIIPTDAELEFGRIDFYNLPAFEESETELYKRYLSKNHLWRNAEISMPYRAAIVNHFPVEELNESPSSNAWQNLSSLLGLSEITEYDDRYVLRDSSYLWYWGSGPGSFNSSFKALYTDELALYNHNAIFTVVFGSYNGDWDSEDNVLRAAIASNPSILTSTWAGRPFWQFIHMGLGMHIGYATKLSLNNRAGSYPSSAKYGSRGVHISFMGDPTLKMYNIPPVSGITSEKKGNSIILKWQSDGDNDGYYIYKSVSLEEKFQLINENPVKINEFTDVNPYLGDFYYMIRPVKLTETTSGSFYNLGRGKFIPVSNYPETPEKSLEALVFPNPADSYFKIYLYTDNPGYLNIDIYDITGKKVTNLFKGKSVSGWQEIDNITEINLNYEFAPGLYFINMKNDNKIITKPIIIQR